MRSDSRSRLAESELSAAALDRVARQAAALALAPPNGAADAVPSRQPEEAAGAAPAAAAVAAPTAAGEHEQEAGLPGAATPGLPPEPPAALRPAAAAASAAADREGEPGEAAGEGEEERIYAREATLAYRGDGGDIPVERRPSGLAAAGHGASITFRPAAARAQLDGADGPASTRDLFQVAVASGPGSDAATRGSLHGSVAGSGFGAPTVPRHQRAGSAGSAAGPPRSSVHYKSLSADSTARGACRQGGRQGIGGRPVLLPGLLMLSAHFHPCLPVGKLMLAACWTLLARHTTHPRPTPNPLPLRRWQHPGARQPALHPRHAAPAEPRGAGHGIQAARVRGCTRHCLGWVWAGRVGSGCSPACCLAGPAACWSECTRQLDIACWQLLP